MAIAYSTVSLLGFLTTTAIGGVLLLKGKSIGAKILGVGVLGLMTSLMCKCFGKNSRPAQRFTPSLQADLSVDGYDSVYRSSGDDDNLLHSDDNVDPNDRDFESRRHPVVQAELNETKGQAVEKSAVVAYKPGLFEKFTGLIPGFSRRLTVEGADKAHAL